MSTSDHRTGSCLCESIKFEIAGSPVFTNNCHCLTCQKSYAAVFASLAFYTDSQIKYTFSDPSVLKSYEDKSPESGNVLYRSFCGICGSNVRVTSRDHPGFAGVGVGIIDGDKTDLKPLYEVFCCRKVPWVQPVDGARGQMFKIYNVYGWATNGADSLHHEENGCGTLTD